MTTEKEKKPTDDTLSSRKSTGQGPEKESAGMTTASEKKTKGTLPFETGNPSGIPGDTEISEDVIASIVGHAAGEVEGVIRLGTGGVLRAITGIGRSTEAGKAAGVGVEAGRREAIFDIELTVEYGHSIPEIVRNVREAVATEVKEQVGLVAKEVNITVAAIEFPERISSGRVE